MRREAHGGKPGLAVARSLAWGLAWCLTASMGCSSDGLAKQAPAAPRLERQVLASAPDGLSGLDIDDEGAAWLVPERERKLLVSGKRGTTVLTLVGVPAGLDTEALAIVGPGELMLGTEAQTRRTSDLLLRVAVEGSTARVTSTRTLSYQPWGLTADANRGIEGLCFAGGALVAGLEQVIERDGARFAPLAVLHDERWTHHRLRLTSGRGKLAALDCVTSGKGLRVVGIERHYEVARLLSFTVPLSGPATTIEPVIVEDLAPHFSDLPNFEGVAFEGGDLVLTNDNDSGGRRGDGALWRLQAGGR